MKTLSDLKQDFMTQVNSSHVKYGWDCGHSYSYIDHSLGDIVFDNNDDQNEWDDFTNEWLSEQSDDLPSCQIDINNGKVESMCGCHDHLSLDTDREEVEDIINDLMYYQEVK